MLEMINRVLICILTTNLVVVADEYRKDTFLKHFVVFSNVMYPTKNHLIGTPNHVTLEACAELCFQSSSMMNKVEFSERHNRRSIDMWRDMNWTKLRRRSELGTPKSDSYRLNGMPSVEMCWSFQYITSTGHCLLLNNSAAFELRGYDTLKPASGTTYYELSRSNFGLYAKKPGFALRSENVYTDVAHNTSLDECISACVTSPNLTCNSFVYSRELHVCATSSRIAETKGDLIPTTVYDMYQYAGVWPCNVTLFWEYTPRVIASQSYPYVHDSQVTCNFRIIAPPGRQINLTVTAFFTNQSQCTNNVDGVYIYGERSDSTNFSRTLCQDADNGLQESVISYSGTMDVRISQLHNIVITRLLYEFVPDIHQDVCFQNKCMNNAECEPYGTGYTCICNTRNFTGAFYELSVGNCFSNPCLFNGKCVPTGVSFLCVCPFGTTGNRCETFVGECERQPCLNGTCIPATSVSGFTCACQKGFTGETCEYNINECFSSPCIHGTCYDQIHGYQCICEDSYTGPNCEIDKRLAACSRHECRFGACVVNSTGSYCQCFPGFTGYSCETNIDDCKSSPCAHGACVDHVNSYHCNCYDGFAGRQCNILKEDPCRVNQCVHGYCSVESEGYSCVCEAGYTGFKCESQMVDCNKICVHGNCVQETGLLETKCVCFTNFTGANCDIQQLKECAGSYCFDNGTNSSTRPFSAHSTPTLQTMQGVTGPVKITQEAQRTTMNAAVTTQDFIKHEATNLSSQFKVSSSASSPVTYLSALSTLLATELLISSTSPATELSPSSISPSTKLSALSTLLANELSASSASPATELSISSTPTSAQLSTSVTPASAVTGQSPPPMLQTKSSTIQRTVPTKPGITEAIPSNNNSEQRHTTINPPEIYTKVHPSTIYGIFDLGNTTGTLPSLLSNVVNNADKTTTTNFVGLPKYNLKTSTSTSAESNNKTTVPTIQREKTTSSTVAGYPSQISTGVSVGILSESPAVFTKTEIPHVSSTRVITTPKSVNYRLSSIPSRETVILDTFNSTPVTPVIVPQIDQSTSLTTAAANNQKDSSTQITREYSRNSHATTKAYTETTEKETINSKVVASQPTLTMSQGITSTQETRGHASLRQTTSLPPIISEHVTDEQTHFHNSKTTQHLTVRQTNYRPSKATETTTVGKYIDTSKTTVYSAEREPVTSPSKVGHVTEIQPMSDVSTIAPSVSGKAMFVEATSKGPGVTDSPNVTSATFVDPVAVDLESSISQVVTIESVLIGALFVILLIVIIVAVFIIYKKSHSGTVYFASDSSVADWKAKETSVKKRYSAREIHTDVQTGKLCRPELYQRQNYNRRSGNFDEVESPDLAIPKNVRHIRPTIGKRLVNLSCGSGVISPKGHTLQSDDSSTHTDEGSCNSGLSSIENPFFKFEDGSVGLNLAGHHRSRTQEEFQSLLEEILDAEDNVTVNRPGMRNTIYHITGTDGGKSEV